MGQGLELTGLAGTLALALPLLVLLLVVVRGTRARGARRRERLDSDSPPTEAPVADPSATSVAGAATTATASAAVAPPPNAAPAAAPQPVALPPAQPTAPTSAVPPFLKSRAEAVPPVSAPPAPAPDPLSAAEPEAEAEPVPPPPDPVEVAKQRAGELARLVAEAESAGRERELPNLHLEEARALAAAGDAASAADRLRKSLRASAKLGLKLDHAKARIELGDLAAQHGDLTTACEHWSIARSIVHELKRPDDIKQAEARMRNNGCPTDWVLNDF